MPEYYLQDYKKEIAENGDVIVTKDGTYTVVADRGFSVHKEAFRDFKYCIARTTTNYSEGEVVDDTGYIDELVSCSNVPSTPPILACYDRKNHKCDGSCQGFSDCIMAKYYRGEKLIEPTKKEMKEYIEEAKMFRRAFNKICNDETFKKRIEDVSNKVKYK